MTCDILIVSCARHFPWLRYALLSCKKFAKGFRQIKILIPSEDLEVITPLLTELSQKDGIGSRVQCYEDWPGKGFLRHEHIIMCSDEFTDADFVCHIDSDCMFTEPVTPEDYFVNGKPVLMYASYEWLRTVVQANLDMWRVTVENAIGGTSVNEFMRRHPAIHARSVYPLARGAILLHTGKPADDYIRSCQESFPQGFCEFNTLGEVAWRNFNTDYQWLNHQQLHETGTPWPNNKLVQFSSGNSPANQVLSPDQPQKPYYKDKPFECTPESLLKML